MTAYYLMDRVPTSIVQNSTISTAPVPLYGSAGVVTQSEMGCWTYSGTPSGDYGVTTYRGVRVGVHRLAYTLAVGPIPDGLEIDHMCRNTKCWNPEHLDIVTTAENTLRATYHREGFKAPAVSKEMPPDVWLVASRMVKFRPSDLVFELSRKPGRKNTTRQTVQRWLRQDPRANKIEHGWYQMESPELGTVPVLDDPPQTLRTRRE